MIFINAGVVVYIKWHIQEILNLIFPLHIFGIFTDLFSMNIKFYQGRIKSGLEKKYCLNRAFKIFFLLCLNNVDKKSTITTKSRSQFLNCDIWYMLNKLEKLRHTEQNEISIEFPVHELLSQCPGTNCSSLEFVIQMWNLVYNLLKQIIIHLG